MGFEIVNGVLKKYTEEPGVFDVIIPDNVTEIGYAAFAGCTSPTRIMIPDGVTIIGYRAFAYCKRLTSIVIPDTSADPKMEDVNAVVEAVGLKPDIDQMPMGIQTVLSESGNTISGGQQQRILIARAIMNKPKILYFDEATSALDNLTQAKVCQSLDAMHVTRIVIAHRLSTIQNCDRILVLNNGSICEEGNFESLMARKGLFYNMAKRQIAEEE